ncbi:hypothetical protein [Flavobacterium sp. ACN6]|uniref:hypothetical protein n=1 Tax=Flavobacterium sp. ACN6 TaxID=1920426 RepID=UPI000BB39BED|nr:hypothetical protein [Flavobacterium sp. ACN6]PBJ06650.1 hypothetical protein BSF42_41070 [Flavobacterium sp. ACN6]
MKKTISTIFGLAALSLATLTTSCSSDDKNDVPTSDFVVVRDNLQGEINSGEVILESGTYKLTGKLVVKNTAKLTIKPGVIIEATALAADQLQAVRYIAVAQGGQIDVQGTATNPVVMTSEVKKPAAWGGLVLCGKAPINKNIGSTATAEVSELAYGGTDAADNSGSIKYLRIEYPGFSYSSDKEFNGISFFGVGNKTVVDYVQVFESSDDGFEWFGGTVNATHLVVSNKDAASVGDDLFDWTEGWNGTGENFYGIRTNAGNRGIEADNNANNHLATPISFPTIKNLTLIGAGVNDTSAESQAFKLRVGTKGKFDNVVLKGWKTGFDVQHDESISYTGTDLLATNVKFEDVTVKSKATATTPVTGVTPDISKLFTESATATGAGNGSGVPTWTAGWTKGL